MDEALASNGMQSSGLNSRLRRNEVRRASHDVTRTQARQQSYTLSEETHHEMQPTEATQAEQQAETLDKMSSDSMETCNPVDAQGETPSESQLEDHQSDDQVKPLQDYLLGIQAENQSDASTEALKDAQLTAQSEVSRSSQSDAPFNSAGTICKTLAKENFDGESDGQFENLAADQLQDTMHTPEATQSESQLKPCVEHQEDVQDMLRKVSDNEEKEQVQVVQDIKAENRVETEKQGALDEIQVEDQQENEYEDQEQQRAKTQDNFQEQTPVENPTDIQEDSTNVQVSTTMEPQDDNPISGQAKTQEVSQRVETPAEPQIETYKEGQAESQAETQVENLTEPPENSDADLNANVQTNGEEIQDESWIAFQKAFQAENQAEAQADVDSEVQMETQTESRANTDEEAQSEIQSEPDVADKNSDDSPSFSGHSEPQPKAETTDLDPRRLHSDNSLPDIESENCIAAAENQLRPSFATAATSLSQLSPADGSSSHQNLGEQDQANLLTTFIKLKEQQQRCSIVPATGAAAHPTGAMVPHSTRPILCLPYPVEQCGAELQRAFPGQIGRYYVTNAFCYAYSCNRMSIEMAAESMGFEKRNYREAVRSIVTVDPMQQPQASQSPSSLSSAASGRSLERRLEDLEVDLARDPRLTLMVLKPPTMNWARLGNCLLFERSHPMRRYIADKWQMFLVLRRSSNFRHLQFFTASGARFDFNHFILYTANPGSYQRDLMKYLDAHPGIYILKRTNYSQGIGIRIYRAQRPNTVEKLRNCIGSRATLNQFVMQKYIERPLLVDKRKFDLRVYMMLLSCKRPTQRGGFEYSYFAFCYPGYVKLSCYPYSHMSHDLNVHLTNQFVQKQRRSLYYRVKEATTWFPDELNDYLNKRGRTEVDWCQKKLYERIRAIVGYTAAAFRPYLESNASPASIFRLYGPDFIIDEDLRVWLLEVNTFPSYAKNTTALSGSIRNMWREAVTLATEATLRYRNRLPMEGLNTMRNFRMAYSSEDPGLLAQLVRQNFP